MATKNTAAVKKSPAKKSASGNTKAKKPSSNTSTSKAKKAPWDKENPKQAKGKAPKKLSTSEKSEAKTRAKKAGRPYPNLVDNMAVAKKKSGNKKKSG